MFSRRPFWKFDFLGILKKVKVFLTCGTSLIKAKNIYIKIKWILFLGRYIYKYNYSKFFIFDQWPKFFIHNFYSMFFPCSIPWAFSLSSFYDKKSSETVMNTGFSGTLGGWNVHTVQYKRLEIFHATTRNKQWNK